MDTSNPVSHFFTIPSQITQSAGQAFGPASATSYRISAAFNATASAKAFAICKGIVMIQSNASSASKVNLILKPYTQPISGVNIKYFIYRGLRKSDFFDSSGIVLTSGSDFITKIRDDFNSFHADDPVNPNPPFLAKYIGFDPQNQPDTLLIDDFFFKESQYVESGGEFVEDEDAFGAFELPLITMGASLGYFSAGECAVDVVLDYGDYRPLGELGEFNFNLYYARANKVSIVLPGNDVYEDKVIKEQIFQFLDIAAYFGSHTDNGTVIIDNNGTKENKTGTAIYSAVLTNFNTKNQLYLYIQSDRTRSYNFYGTYNIAETDNSLKYGTVVNSLTDRIYATQGWPVIIESPSTSSIFLQFLTDNNVNTVLYGQKATILNGAKNNFSNAQDLILPADEAGNLSSFTKILELSNPNSSFNAPVISTFNIIIYQGMVYKYLAGETLDENNNLTPIYFTPIFLDDIFDLGTTSNFVTEENQGVYKISFYKIKVLNNFFEGKQLGSYALQNVFVRDFISSPNLTKIERVIYITETIETLNSAGSFLSEQSSLTYTSSSSSLNLSTSDTYSIPPPFFISTLRFEDEGRQIQGLILNQYDGAIPSKVAIGITRSENLLLVDLINDGQFTNKKIIMVDIFDTANTVIKSSEGIKYQKYKLAVAVENSSGNLQLLYPSTNVFVFSIDRKFYFSDGFSEYVPDSENLKDDIVINIELAI
ncbi:hypothetical protein AM493_01050 [Flavobacterium akiainvivens]|uniref:Uncharacterized protein n=1 Tax=Flavobacterium akiainvivens TaxID=1202724 RepID=A0A0M9VGS3_9FLAO|nr:hypothetical protein [Flavobacterium akiainvivens]KOS04786.1 hypothetical protein AM493_01050 [Flavobacterium akiainvivens]SFQ66272.1 hypothetical protein SAMN05444144_11311 [Flavobacterium akiainvivens]